MLGVGVGKKGVRNRNFFSPKKLAQALATVEREVGRDSRECIIYRIE